MIRQIILDTETTGIGPEHGHRVIEIGCVELIDRKLTGNHFHEYINPSREVDEEAFKVHGISNAFLLDKPYFGDILSGFLQFISGAELIIHNAAFDVGFLNSELRHVQHGKKLENYCTVLDTLALARKKHPGQRVSLDALCKRYDIDNSNRQLHGALLDAEILALVYLAMTGGQRSLFTENEPAVAVAQSNVEKVAVLALPDALVLKASEEEQTAHNQYVQFLQKKSGINYWEEKFD